jgi:hypothetical protein
VFKHDYLLIFVIQFNHNMRLLGLYAIVLFTAAFLFFKPTTNSRSFGGASEEHARQKALELLMLADPATGKIPVMIRSKELAYYTEFFGNQKNYRMANWESVGPYNQGGRTRQVALDIANENNILAATVSGGIWRSGDGGASWTRVSNENGFLGAVGLSQDTRAGKQNIWYAISGEASGNSASGGNSYYLGDGAFKSIDSGKSWQPLVSTATGTANSFSVPYQVCWRIATHPDVDSDRVFAATYGAILMSTDGGDTWRYVVGDLNNAAYYTDVEVAANGDIYATLSNDGSSAKGFYRSADKGNTWTNITPTSLLNNYDRTVLCVNPNNNKEVYFFSYLIDSTNPGGTTTSNYKGTKEYISLLKYTYITGDGTGTGGQWTNLSPNLPNNANVPNGSFDKLNCQGGYDMLVKMQPGTNTLFIGGTNLFSSTDAFTTKDSWKQLGGYAAKTELPNFGIWPNHHPDNHDLVFYPSNPNKIISANDGGLYRCNDASSSQIVWQSLNRGYITTQLYTVTLAPNAGNRWLLGGFQDNGNFITTDYRVPNKFWMMPFNGDGAYNYLAPNNAFAVMSIQEGKMGKFKLDEDGRNIIRNRIDPIGPSADDYLFINPIAVDPNDNNIMYVPAGKKLYRQSALTTLPYENKWDSISTGYFKLTDTIKSANVGTGGLYPSQITCIAISKQPTNVVYIGTSNKDVYRIENANTGDPKFTKINKGIFNNGYVSGLAVDPEDANQVIACVSNYNILSMFYSKDGGTTWNYCGGNLEKTSNFSGAQPSIRTVGILKTPTGGRRYFAATSIGLFSTDNLKYATVSSKDSTVWLQESINGIGTTVVNHLAIRQEDYTVAVSTHGNGAYITQYYPSTAAPSVTSPTMQLQPNLITANDYIRVTIDNNKSTTAKLIVVDAMGKTILNLGDQQLNVGTNQISANVRHLAPGNYFMAYLDSDKKKLIQKFTIIK